MRSGAEVLGWQLDLSLRLLPRETAIPHIAPNAVQTDPAAANDLLRSASGGSAADLRDRRGCLPCWKIAISTDASLKLRRIVLKEWKYTLWKDKPDIIEVLIRDSDIIASAKNHRLAKRYAACISSNLI